MGEPVKKICKYIKNNASNPLVIGLQEVQLTGGKYLTILKKEFPQYHIVLPYAYENQPRSVVCILLINKSLCTSYNVMTLDKLEESLRYNYVQVKTPTGPFKILNIHLPQTTFNNHMAPWYIKSRFRLRTAMENALLNFATLHRTEPAIIMGDLNACPTSALYETLATTPIDRPFFDSILPKDSQVASWCDRHLNAGRIDYIMYSWYMVDQNSPYVCRPGKIIQDTISDKLSDHALIVASIEGRFDGCV